MTRYPNGDGGAVLGHYELPPNQLGEAYPPDYRVNQIEQRADEVQGLLHLLCPTHPSAKRTPISSRASSSSRPTSGRRSRRRRTRCGRELGDVLEAIDFDKTVLGGFSYGAATTALVAARTGGAGVRGVFFWTAGTTSTSPRFGRARRMSSCATSRRWRTSAASSRRRSSSALKCSLGSSTSTAGPSNCSASAFSRRRGARVPGHGPLELHRLLGGADPDAVAVDRVPRAGGSAGGARRRRWRWRATLWSACVRVSDSMTVVRCLSV